MPAANAAGDDDGAAVAADSATAEVEAVDDVEPPATEDAAPDARDIVPAEAGAEAAEPADGTPVSLGCTVASAEITVVGFFDALTSKVRTWSTVDGDLRLHNHLEESSMNFRRREQAAALVLPAGDDVPALHSVQEPDPAAEYLPAGHVAQAEEVDQVAMKPKSFTNESEVRVTCMKLPEEDVYVWLKP